MCGIAGLIDPAMPTDEVRCVLERMTAAIVHRGPDDHGFFAAPGVGLGMRRLSIIDIAGGHQPISNEDGRVQVVFNGEIYNYLPLRTELDARGHALCTRSDTEVIAHLYEEMGSECLTKLRGMFGIAVWDQQARRLLLARDRLGKKPLFYAHLGDRLLFGSEIKSILAADPSLAEVNEEAIISYFQLGYVPEPDTMFRRIRKLPAGHYLTYEDGKIAIAPYWQIQFGESNGAARSHREWVEELDALLEEAVRIRLMSEVPLGVFLSGGIDSSTIVAYAHKAGLRPLKTFTIGFDRPEWDESADAQRVADHFQTEHHVLSVREQDLRKGLSDTLLTLVRHFDEPFGDPSALPTYYVSKLAREHVTVILSGDGGDELFAGYTTYQGIKFAEHYQHLPAWLGRHLLPTVAQRAAPWLPARQRYSALRVAKVLRDSSLPFEEVIFNKSLICRNDFLQRLFTDAMVRRHPQMGQPSYAQDITAMLDSELPALSKMSYVGMRRFLLDDILVKVDRMSMAHSLEVRSPLLDHHLVEFATRLPPSEKLRGWQTKAILRDTVGRYLPAPTMRKQKQGFRVPLRDWFRTDLSEMVGDYLDASNRRLPSDIFNHGAIKTLLKEHRSGESDHSRKIWLLLNYAAWQELYTPHG